MGINGAKFRIDHPLRDVRTHLSPLPIAAALGGGNDRLHPIVGGAVERRYRRDRPGWFGAGGDTGGTTINGRLTLGAPTTVTTVKPDAASMLSPNGMQFIAATGSVSGAGFQLGSDGAVGGVCHPWLSGAHS